MAHNKAESLHFYKYLCDKIGSEEVVKARRLTLTCRDMAATPGGYSRLSSGSKGEGLNLNGSDFDLMFVDSGIKVYESERVAVQDHGYVLVMETEDTQPCYTYLHLLTNYDILPHIYKHLFQQQSGKKLISNELYKLWMSNHNNKDFRSLPVNNIHGPCLSDKNDKFDIAFCLKCDQWVSQAQPWITRPRATWPSPEMISKITSCGVLFVPIGYKGSRNEHLQWRISFSIAEKLLIYSFNHTQLLCYALLKILLKEIVDRNENLKGLLCSYFLKTLMFWISEETEPYIWRSDNIIPCYKVCLKRLLYCFEYSTLLHYFIPNNNLFYLRFNNKNRDTLFNLLKNAYVKGIKIFSTSDILHDYRRFPNEITRSKSKKARLIQEIEIFLHTDRFLFQWSTGGVKRLFNTLLYYCRTEMSKSIFTISLSNSHKMTLQQKYNPNNKHQYNNYRHDLSRLLVGSHSDAVSGWLTLASFFYFHKHYLQSIAIINYAMSKCTNEFPVSNSTSTFIKKQECELKMIIQERLSSVWKKILIQMVLLNSVNIPTELDLNILQEHHIVAFDHISFAHLLSSLINYHLKDNITGRQTLFQFIDRQIKVSKLEGFKNNNNDLMQNYVLHIFSNPNYTRQFCKGVARLFNMLTKVL